MEHQDNLYTVVPMVSIRPNKIVFYNRFFKNFQVAEKTPNNLNDKDKQFLMSIGVGRLKRETSNEHKFEISQKASARIKEKITWLYQLSKRKNITLNNGKQIFNFKMCFITLTLPAIQKHTSKEITNKCLNQFITEVGERFGMKNYVWRLEFQKNGNAHYHLATDTFIEYWQARSIWNRILNKLGYIEEYSNKFSKYSFQDYYKEFHKEGEEDNAKLIERYTYGKATRWENPNTVDVKNVTSSKNIAFYISKYITKKSEVSLNKKVLERDGDGGNFRLWFCSRSLSKVSKIEVFLEECNKLVDNFMNNLKNVKKFVFEYCSVQYFNYTEQSNEFKKYAWSLFQNYANDVGYFT